MTQLSLFDAAPLARRTDPETSHVAARAIEPKLKGQRRMVLELVIRNPKCTSAEVCRFCNFPNVLATVRRRLPELVKLGYVRALLPRTCRELGSLQTTYEWTGKEYR